MSNFVSVCYLNSNVGKISLLKTLFVTRNCVFCRTRYGEMPLKKCVNRNFSNTNLPLDNIASLSKDILLYSFERGKFFRYLGILGFVQLFCWTFWGTDMYRSLKNIKQTDELQIDYLSRHPIWRRINLGEKKFRIAALASCLAIGIGTLGIMLTLPTRIVRYLVLCKGGTTASFTTYGPFGHSRTLNVPLRYLSCQNTREEAKAYISIKIKGKWMYFLLDCRGKFFNPQLFDYTVGAKTW